MTRLQSVLHHRYLIVEEICQGGMGSVFRGFDQETQREVAIKEVHIAEGRSDSFLKRKFAMEVEMLKHLDHPQIPRIWDSFTDGSFHYIIMEFIAGQNLNMLVQDYLSLSGAPMPELLAIDCAMQVCGILRYLHERPPKPILHRDVKPGNLILRQEPAQFVLVDFGLACWFNPNTATSAGTLGYVAREQLQGHAEPRSDLYGLGATLYYLLCGVKPPPLRVCSPRELGRNIAPELDAIVKKATQPRPEERFESAADMERALRRARGRQSNR